MKKEKGITLIALVITIIVMLILVGITLQITLGQNGIVTKAKEAVLAQEKESKKEEVTLAIAALAAERNGDTTNIEAEDILRKLDPNETRRIEVEEDNSNIVIIYPSEETSIDKAIEVIIDEDLKIIDVEVRDEGTGEGDWIPIYDADDLRDVEDNPSGHYQLQNNIDISGENWNAIPSFSGILDGNNKTITMGNLNITSVNYYTGEDYIPIYLSGLIGISTGEIKDLKVQGNPNNENKISITNTNNCEVDVTFLIGIMTAANLGGTIENCSNSGDIEVDILPNKIPIVSGCAANNMGTIQNYYNTGDIYVEGDDACLASGIAASNYENSIIQNCYNSGNISIVGGINAGCKSAGITSENSGTIQNCYNTGNISAEGQSVTVGGIASEIYDNSIIQNCYNIGNINAISSNPYKGSIIGHISSSETVTVQRNYYLTGTALTGTGDGDDEVGKVEAMTENNMKQSTFVDLLNTGFENLPWEYVSNQYPRLSWE